MSASGHPTEVPALGRHLQLGQLYDCCRDAPVPGAVLLWDENTVRENIQAKPNHMAENHVLDSDSLEDKLSALKVQESLRASLLCGLVEAKGSAKFLEDHQSSSQQARVSLQYAVATQTKQLNVANLLCHSECNPQGATHVVTGVQYGAQVFFVFDWEVFPSEDREEMQKDLRAMVERLSRSLSVEAEGGMPRSAQVDQAKAGKKITCRIYGDVLLADHPVTFQEAANIYSTLPKLLPEKAVPVRFWLYPLHWLNSKLAFGRFQEIDSELVSEMQKMLQQLLEKEMRCNDLASNGAATTFPEIRRKLQRFQGVIRQIRGNLRKRLSKSIPLVRKGEEEEEVLTDILASMQQTVLGSEHLGTFLERWEKEMMFVNAYLDVLKGVEVVATKKDLDRVLANPLLTRVIAFVFSSLQEDEASVSDLENALTTRTVLRRGSAAPPSQVPKATPWFEDRNIKQKARGTAKAFLGLAPLSSEEMKLVVTALPDQDHPGVSIYLYEDGELVSTSLELPSKPCPPAVGEIGQNTIQLTFKPSPFGRGAVSGYRVESRVVRQESWVAVQTPSAEEAFTLTGLQPETEYQLRYAVAGQLGLSESSEVSGSVKTLPLCSPRKPEEAQVGQQAVPLAGQESSLPRPDSSSGWESHPVEESGKGGRAPPQEGEGARRGQRAPEPQVLPEKPEVSLPGNQSLVAKMIRESSPLGEVESLSVYRLPLERSATSCSGFTKYRLGNNDPRRPHKVIMMMGATGSGKTTLINGMANYILGVAWEDRVRFKLIHEETSRGQDQSQTSEVTAYEINHRKGFQVPFNLTIIDTPGFGDTRGIEKDKLITQKVREFFTTPGGIDHIDGVCFVVQASLARLTHTQKYIFDSVLSIFGKDIKSNIQILVTFADGQKPPVLQAILASEVPCGIDDHGSPVHFKFNNSALFACNSEANEGGPDFSAMFWKMGTSSMKTYFTSLSSLEPRSLQLTKEVLRERKRLEAAIEGLQPQIKIGLMKLEAIRKTRQALEQHQDEMEANKDFEVEIDKPVTRKVEVTEGFLTNCQKCSFTCHYPCFIPNDQDKHKCAAMDGRQHCSVCPGKCFWNVHFNQKYRWEYDTVKEKQTYGQIKAKYEKACGEVMTAKKIFEQVVEEYEDVKGHVLVLIEESTQSIDRLQEIALWPNPMATPEHIDLLIESEKQEAKPGFQERIKTLEGVREMAVVVNKIARGESLLPSEEETAKRYKGKPSRCRRAFNFVKEWIFN